MYVHALMCMRMCNTLWQSAHEYLHDCTSRCAYSCGCEGVQPSPSISYIPHPKPVAQCVQGTVTASKTRESGGIKRGRDLKHLLLLLKHLLLLPLLLLLLLLRRRRLLLLFVGWAGPAGSAHCRQWLRS